MDYIFELPITGARDYEVDAEGIVNKCQLPALSPIYTPHEFCEQAKTSRFREMHAPGYDPVVSRIEVKP